LAQHNAKALHNSLYKLTKKLNRLEDEIKKEVDNGNIKIQD